MARELKPNLFQQLSVKIWLGYLISLTSLILTIVTVYKIIVIDKETFYDNISDILLSLTCGIIEAQSFKWFSGFNLSGLHFLTLLWLFTSFSWNLFYSINLRDFLIKQELDETILSMNDLNQHNFFDVQFVSIFSKLKPEMWPPLQPDQ